MVRTERSSEDRPADEAGPCRAKVPTGPLVQRYPLPLDTTCQKLVIAGSSEPPLTSSELRGQVSLAQLLPALPTMGQFHVAGNFQDGETQTGKEEAESALWYRSQSYPASGGKGLFSSTIKHKVSKRGVRSFKESPRGPVSTGQDGHLVVNYGPHTQAVNPVQ